jgi:hypothetical protein
MGMPELRPPRNQAELAALHDLRDTVLFRGRGQSGYDRHHPDDQSPANHFTGFWQHGELLGTLRVDFLDDETAALRLVAVEPRGKPIVNAADRRYLPSQQDLNAPAIRPQAAEGNRSDLR